jgi:NhaP-type Na+/H+ and K+/H+ antiporter
VPVRLRRHPLVGDRIRLADVELVVRSMRDERISEVGIDLEPRRPQRPSLAQLRPWLQRRLARLRRALPWNSAAR